MLCTPEPFNLYAEFDHTLNDQPMYFSIFGKVSSLKLVCDSAKGILAKLIHLETY